MQEKYIAIIDHVGRTIIGKEVAEGDTTLIVNNPVILHCQPESNGSLNVQTFPLFFFEFIDKTKRENNNWTYTKSNIVLSDVTLDERIINQYKQLNTPPAVAPMKKNPKVITISDLD